MRHFISDHTPMDDYQWIIKQAYCTIEGTDDYISIPDNKAAGLKDNRAYRFIAVSLKVLLILAGILALCSVIVFFIWNRIGENYVLKKMAMSGILSAAGSFGAAILFAIVGAAMESHSAGKDKNIRADKRRRTLLLNNGSIAVIYKLNGRHNQIPTRFFDFKEGSDVDVPFSEMYLISKVHSVRRENGNIAARVKCLEYLMIHPYVNEYEGDPVEHFFRYYTRKIHKRIVWSDKMADAEKLMSALNALIG